MWALQDILFPGRVRPVKSQQIQTRLEMDALSLRYNLPKCTKSVPTGPEIERTHVMFQQYFQFFFLFWESVQIKDRLRSDDVIWSGAIDSE